MTTAEILVLVQLALARYVLSTILVLGNIGNIISIIIFSQKKRRKNSCSIYLLAASIFGLIITNWAIIPLVYALDHVDIFSSSLILCRIRGYIINSCSMCFRYIIVLACVDRFAMCSPRTSIRTFCRPKIAYCSIAIITGFWVVGAFHLLVFESIENGRCGVYGLYGFIFSIYSIVCFGLVPTSSMIIFLILLLLKLRRFRLRVTPLTNNYRIKRVDSNLVKLVVAEVVVSIICTFNHPLMTFYLTLTNNMTPNKSAERLKIESFVNFITMSLLLYSNYTTTFYVYLATSKSFRLSVKQLAVKCSQALKCNIRNIEHEREN